MRIKDDKIESVCKWPGESVSDIAHEKTKVRDLAWCTVAFVMNVNENSDDNDHGGK